LFRDVAAGNRNVFEARLSRAAARRRAAAIAIRGNGPFTMMGESAICACEQGGAAVLRCGTRAFP
jgi:hypothetical protein